MVIEAIGGGPEMLAARATVWMADRLWEAIAAREVAHVAVSGGTTPRRMLDELATLRLPWDRVHIWQVDERVAPDGDPDRNANQLAPLAAARLHLMTVTAPDPETAAAAYAREIRENCGGVFDLVHLGVGGDGHTASWPPGVELRDDQDVAVVGPFNGRVRLTLTEPPVNRARARMILAAGIDKAAVLAAFISGTSTAPLSRLRRDQLTILGDAAALPDLARSASVE